MPDLACCLLSQELKGNIRVFCRVRPIVGVDRPSTDADSQSLAVEFPETSDVLSAGIVLQVGVTSLSSCITSQSSVPTWIG